MTRDDHAILRAHPDPSSIKLSGGESVIPFWPLQNPVTDRNLDPDAGVLSDNPYGSLENSSHELLAPLRSVGRLPFAASATLAQVLTLLEGVAAGAAQMRAGATLIVNQDWLSYSQRTTSTMPTPQTW